MAPRPYYSEPGDRLESVQPVEVSRYRGFTRANHWVTAFCLIVLALSGLALFNPALYFLTALFGGGRQRAVFTRSSAWCCSSALR